MANLAFLGLGVMGFPMAGHLQKAGHSVTVYNRSAAKAEAWVAKHGGAYYVCARPDGCLQPPYAADKFIVDPAEEPESFATLSKL